MDERPENWGPDWSARQERVLQFIFKALRTLSVGTALAVWWLLTNRVAIAVLVVAGLVFGGVHIIQLERKVAILERALGGEDILACDVPAMITRVSRSVVRVIGGEGEGSGFVLQSGDIVTNHHVIDGEPSPKIVFSDGTYQIGHVFATDPGFDVALIRVDRTPEALEWGDANNIAVGTDVFSFGYPYGGELNGEVTVNRTNISATRIGSGDRGLWYIQTAGGVIEGMSGGPVVDVCGRIVGINVAGQGASVGLALSGTSAQSSTDQMIYYPESYQEGISRISYEPDKSPVDAVRAYYNYLKVRNFEKAYELLSPNFIGEVSFNEWVFGFATELDTTVWNIKQLPGREPRIQVSISSTDLSNGKIVYRYFSGTWIVHRENGHYRLWESNIKETIRE